LHCVAFEAGLLQIPPGMDIVSFLQFDGKASEPAVQRDAVTLKLLREEYLKVHSSAESCGDCAAKPGY
jgi:hypothetical protein